MVQAKHALFHILVLSFILFLLSVPVTAQGYMDVEIEGNVVGEQVTVHVFDRDTGEPLSDVLVEVYKDYVYWKNRVYKLLTDSDGIAAFVIDEAGTYTFVFTFEKEGYYSLEETVEFTSSGGNTTENYMRVDLSSAFVDELVTVSVYDRDSNVSLPDVLVEIFRGDASSANLVYSLSTDNAGKANFVIDEVDTYIFICEKIGYVTVELSIDFIVEEPSTTTTSSTTTTTTSTTSSTTTSTTTTTTTTTTTITSTTTTTSSVTTTTRRHDRGRRPGFLEGLFNWLMGFLTWLFNLFRGLLRMFGFR